MMSGVAAEIRIVDAEGNYVQTPPATQTETVQEQATVDFSQLPHGLFPEQWSTTIEGLGRVTIWMEGGVKVDASGIQPKNQPSGGTGWWMRFDDGPVTLVSADTQSAGSTNGMFRVVQNGDYLREGGAVKNFSLHDPTFGGIAAERLDEGQNGSPIALKSVTVQRTVTRTVDLNPVTQEDLSRYSFLLTEPEVEPDPALLEADFTKFGVRTTQGATLTARLDERLAPAQFVGDGGIIVSAGGTLRSLAEGEGRGDWALLLQNEEILSVTLNHLGGGRGQPFLHVIGDRNEYHTIAPGTQTFVINMKNVREISISCADHRIELSGMTLVLPEAVRGQTVFRTAAEPVILTAEQTAGLSGASIRSLTGARPDLEPGAARLRAETDAQGFTTLLLDSPYDESYVVTPAGTLHFSHVGGVENLTVLRRQLFSMVDMMAQEPRAEFTVYADVAQAVELERLVFRGDRTTNVFTQESAEHEERPEHWTDPELQVLHTGRATVTVAYGSPYRNAVLEIAGGGRFASKSLSSDSPLRFGTATLSIDGTLQSGTYVLRLLDRANGTVLKTVDLAWNAETKMLSVEGGIQPFTPFASVRGDAQDIDGSILLAEAQEQAQVQTAAAETAAQEFIDTFGGAIHTNVPDTPQGRLVVEQQRMSLVELAAESGYDLRITREMLWARFTAPGSQWADRTFATAAEASEFDYVRGVEFTRYANTLGSYEAALGRMMQAAMDTVLAARRGQPYTTHLSSLQAIPNDPTYGNQLVILSQLGVHLPSTESMLEAAESTLRLQANAYKQMLGGAYGSAQRLLEKMESPTYAGGGTASAPSRRNGFDMTAWHEAMRQAALETQVYFVSMNQAPPATAYEIPAPNAKIITPEGDVLSQMTLETLTRIKQNAETAYVSAVARGDREQAEHFRTQRDAAVNLLALIPAGQIKPVISAEHTQAWGWVRTIEQTTSDPLTINGGNAQVTEVNNTISLGNVTTMNMKDFKREMTPGVPEKFTFTLTQESMVNFGVRGPSMMSQPRDLKLEITSSNQSVNYPGQNNANGTPETLSVRLGPGTYTVTIRDLTTYGSMVSPPNTGKFTVTCNATIVKFNSANIEGMMSINSSDKIMPVRMRVANFYPGDNGQRNVNYDLDVEDGGVNKLNPNLPVWVVVHGMDDFEDSAGIESVARELRGYGVQVVTISWSEAAKAILKSGNDAPWTKPVGEWTAAQLVGLGFDAENIHIAGHSHGTYVAYAMASQVMSLTSGSQVGSIVALDPAGNVELLSGFDDDVINFKNVSRNSLAIEGSFISGSNHLASTADTSFQIDSATTHTPFAEHGLPVTTFANILKAGRLSPSRLPQSLTLQGIMTPIDLHSHTLDTDAFRGSYEGIITVSGYSAYDPKHAGSYYIGLPQSVEWKQPNGSLEEEDLNDLFSY